MEDAREGHRETQRARETNWDFWNVRFNGFRSSGGETHVSRQEVLGTIIARVPRRARVSILRHKIGSKVGHGKSHRAVADVPSRGVREIFLGEDRLRSDFSCLLYTSPSPRDS